MSPPGPWALIPHAKSGGDSIEKEICEACENRENELNVQDVDIYLDPDCDSSWQPVKLYQSYPSG